MKNILIADDTEFMRRTLRHILEEAGFNIVAEAENGVVAIEKYKIYRPDIVLMDIVMPVMNGIEALKEIMTINSEAKVVIVSAMGQETIVSDAIMNGAEAFIVKPFKNERLVELVTQLI